MFQFSLFITEIFRRILLEVGLDEQGEEIKGKKKDKKKERKEKKEEEEEQAEI